MTRRIVASRDPGLQAVVTDLEPLFYAAGASAEEDYPAWVRAGSAVRTWGPVAGTLAIVQDDTNVLALRLPDGSVEALLLPRGAGGRRVFGDDLGNKAAKLDLESAVVLPDGRLVAFGSGSTPARQMLVAVSRDFRMRLVDGAPLYAKLRHRADFAGSELNVEGAVLLGDRLRLFQRGNGAPRGGLEPVDAWGDLDLGAFLAWLDADARAPELHGVTQLDLGAVGGVRFTVTDAATLPDGRLALLASAEASPDTFRDGAVSGCRLVVVEGDDVAWAADVVDASGAPILAKLEGLELLASTGERHRFAVVADPDDVSMPALFGTLEVTLRPAAR